ncbi:MAG: hypothetical protein Q7T63_21800 [Burkholderiaceae bacterium]|nr:hypothetical protein [Burkholderiaceae bacterium]MDO9088645.1 hypothetical protein [Burkholderiaceae bacterium]
MKFSNVASMPPMGPHAMIIEPAPSTPYDPHGPASGWLSYVNSALTAQTAGAPVNPEKASEALVMALSQSDWPAVQQLIRGYGARPAQMPPLLEQYVSPEMARHQLTELAGLANDTTASETVQTIRTLLENPIYAQASLLRDPVTMLTPLMVAAANRDSEDGLQAFLDVPGANPNLRAPDGKNALDLALHAYTVPDDLPCTEGKIIQLLDHNCRANTNIYAPGEMPVDNPAARALVENNIPPITTAALKGMPNGTIWALTKASLATQSPGLFVASDLPDPNQPSTNDPIERRCPMEDLVTLLTDPQFHELMNHPQTMKTHAPYDVAFDMSSIGTACCNKTYDRAACLIAGGLHAGVPMTLMAEEFAMHPEWLDNERDGILEAAKNAFHANPELLRTPMVNLMTLFMLTSGLTVDQNTGTVLGFSYAPAVELANQLLQPPQAPIQFDPQQLLEQTAQGTAPQQLVRDALLLLPMHVVDLGLIPTGLPDVPDGLPRFQNFLN